MPKITWKRVWLVVGGILAAIGAAAIWTSNINKAFPIWLSWLPVLGRWLRVCGPWIYWGAVLAISVASLAVVYREWRTGKRLREQERHTELRSLVHYARLLRYEAECCYGPPEKRDHEHGPRNFECALDDLARALVQASIYEERARLYSVLRNMEHERSTGRQGDTWRLIEPFLALIGEWIAYVEKELNPERSLRPRDPLART